MNWRPALMLGVIFIALGTLYWFVQHLDLASIDDAGAALLVMLGVAMAFGFSVLLRGSRDL